MITIHVPASKEYDVLIENGLLDRAGECIASVIKPCTIAVISESTVFPIYGKKVCDSLSEAGFKVLNYVFPAGEESKNISVYGDVLTFLAQNHLSRTDALVALGGGVTGDMAGFAAATYQRGIRYVQIPTTLLSAVDSSVGGKTAIDLPVGKNLVGSFYQPSLVLCDPRTFETLPRDVYLSGCAEVIKYAVLGNAPFFEELSSTPVSAQWEHVISVSIGMKRDIVAEDEFDTGLRRLLNLGHTFGHAMEQKSGFRLSHGFAVAIGMAVICRAASAMGFCPETEAERVIALLREYGLPTECEYSAEEVFEAALSDKKMTGTTMNLIVPDRIGACHVEKIPAACMREWLAAGGVK